MTETLVFMWKKEVGVVALFLFALFALDTPELRNACRQQPA